MYRGKRAGHRAPVTGTPDANFNGQASATGLCTWRARSSPAARGRLGLAGQQPRARDPIRGPGFFVSRRSAPCSGVTVVRSMERGSYTPPLSSRGS